MAKQKHGGHGSSANRGEFQKPKNAKQTLKRILKYFSKNKVLIFAVIVSVFLSSFCSVMGTSWIQQLVDESFYPEFNVKVLLKNIIILAVLYFSASIFSFIQSKIMVQIAWKTTNTIRRDLFDKLQGLPLRYFDSKTHGEKMSRFTNDIDNVQMMLEQSFVQLFSSVIMFVGLIVAMVSKSIVLFGIMLVFLALMIATSAFIGAKTKKYFRLQQKTLGAMNGNIEESIEGMKVVKVFNHEKKSMEEFDEKNEDFKKSATNANFYAGAIGPNSTGLNNAAYAAVTVIGALLVVSGNAVLGQTVTVGALSSFISLAKSFSQPINQITSQMNNIFSALAGAERVFEIMDMEPEIDDGTVTLEEKHTENGKEWYWHDGDKLVKVEGKVDFENVTFSYDGKKVVLHDISLYAKPGQKIAFVGSTGAGKTTITNLINRFYDISDGSITYDGIDIKRIKKDDLRKSLAIVLQDTHLFTGTIMDNIRYGRLDATDEECIDAAKLASAHSFIRRLPDGYNTKITGDGDNLSQGQRQLLAIARAAVADPPVMILDEATSSIDTRTEMHIEHGMDRLMQNRTTFVIAHRLSTVRNSNAIMVLENGRIIERGDHDDLMALGGRYYQLCTGKVQLD